MNNTPPTNTNFSVPKAFNNTTFDPNNHIINSIQCYYCNINFHLNNDNTSYQGSTDFFISICPKCNTNYSIQPSWEWIHEPDPIYPSLEQIANSQHINSIYIAYLRNNNAFVINLNIDNNEASLFSKNGWIITGLPLYQFIILNKKDLINKFIKLLAFI